MAWIFLPVIGLALLGLAVGTLSGLLGIGGGVVLVPMLTFILPIIYVNPDVAIHIALGTSLACTSLTLFSSSLAHRRHGNLNTKIFYTFLPGVLVGAILGPYIVHLLSAEMLRYIIGSILLALAINMAFDYEIPSHRKLPSTYVIVLTAFFIGTLSSFAGLSGAVLIVPYLIWFGIPMRQSVGTAAMCGFPLSVMGMITFMAVGYNVENLPFGAVGYVYWPAVIVIAFTSVPMAQFAAKWSLNLPKESLKRLLAVILTFVSAKMLFF